MIRGEARNQGLFPHRRYIGKAAQLSRVYGTNRTKTRRSFFTQTRFCDLGGLHHSCLCAYELTKGGMKPPQKQPAKATCISLIRFQVVCFSPNARKIIQEINLGRYCVFLAVWQRHETTASDNTSDNITFSTLPPPSRPGG